MNKSDKKTCPNILFPFEPEQTLFKYTLPNGDKNDNPLLNDAWTLDLIEKLEDEEVKP